MRHLMDCAGVGLIGGFAGFGVLTALGHSVELPILVELAVMLLVAGYVGLFCSQLARGRNR